MKNNGGNEDFVDNSQPNVKKKEFKQSILSKTDQILLSPSVALETPRKSAEKIQENKSKDFTPDNQKENISLNSDSDFLTPSKFSNDLFDESLLNELEVVKMLHDTDSILNLDDIQLPTGSVFNCSSLDKNFNNQDSIKKADSLALVDVNNCESRKEFHTKSNSKKFNKSRSSFITKTPKIKLKLRSPRKSKFSDYPNGDFSFSEEEINEETESLLDNLYKAQDKEILSSEIVTKLENLEIKLTHVVPPQHKVETRAGSSSLTRKEKMEFEKFAKRINSKFTEEEDIIIKQNWKSFCKIHDWDEKNIQPFLYLKHQGGIYISNLTERRKFVQFLAKGLPYRTLFSVYSRFKCLFAKPIATGRFTSKEDKRIMIYMNCPESNNKFLELSKILGRSRQSVYKRYIKLKKRYDVPKRKKRKESAQRNILWTLDLIEKFLKNFMEITLSKNVLELKNAVIPQVIWEEMEKRMRIGKNILKNYWFHKLHLQLFSPVPIYLSDVKIKLIEYLSSSGISDPKEIDWTEVSNVFDGMTTAFLCEITYRLLRHVKRKNVTNNFDETVSYLYDNMIPCLKEQYNDKCLPRILYENKKVTILDEVEESQSDGPSEDEFKLSRRSERLKTSKDKKLECEDNCDIVWTLSLREKFFKILLDVMICDDIQELKDAIIPEVVWEKVEEQLEVDRKKLKNLWYKEFHLQLFSSSPIYLNDLKIKLIELIYEKQFKSEKEINWNKICCYFDGITRPFLSQIFSDLVDLASKKTNSSNFCDIAEYLYKEVFPKLRNEPDDKFLPRITFKNNRIKVVNEEFQKGEIDRNEDKSEYEKEEKAEMHWTLPLREDFLNLLLRLNLSTDIKDLKDAIIPKVVWEKMEEQLKVNQNVLQDLWYKELHLQLFSPNPIYLNDIKIKLIELICEKQFDNKNEIDWDKICSFFDGMTTFFLSQLFDNLVNLASEEIDSSNFCDIMKYLYKTMFHKLKNISLDKFLPRITFENKTIKVIDEGSENYEIYKKKGNFKIENETEIRWTLPLREKFLKCLLRLTLSTDIEELKDAVIPKVVWEEMGNQFKVNENVLQDLWFKELHLQLFSPTPIYLNDIKIKLIELIYGKQIKDQKEINWNNICSYFDGMTTVFLAQVFDELVDFASKKNDFANFCDIIQYLYKTMFNELKSVPDDQFLPRITFDNKTLRIVTKESEKGLKCEKKIQFNNSIEGKHANDPEGRVSLFMREKFIKQLLYATLNTNIEELKGVTIPKSVWEIIAKNMKVHEQKLINLWYLELHMQLFCQKPISLNDVQIELIKHFYNNTVTDLEQIKWSNVCKYFDGFTKSFLEKVFRELVQRVSDEINSNDLCDIMKYLYTKHLPILKDNATDKVLPRISYMEGIAKFVDEDLDEEI